MDLQPSLSLQKGRRGRKGKGPYIGVRFRGERWVSEIRVPGTGTRIWLGSHLSAEKAARAYDAALYCLKGENALFNFPDTRRPDISGLATVPSSPEEIQKIQDIAAEFARAGEMMGGPGPSTMRPHRAADFLLASSASSDLLDLNEMSMNVVEGELEPDPYVPSALPEEPCAPISVRDKPYLATSVPEVEPYIPTFFPEEELHVPVCAAETTSLPHGVTPLDEWFATDEDWRKNIHLYL